MTQFYRVKCIDPQCPNNSCINFVAELDELENYFHNDENMEEISNLPIDESYQTKHSLEIKRIS